MNNKIKGLIILTMFSGVFGVSAQIKTQSDAQQTIVGENPFLDASDYGKDGDISMGKGLYFPQTDLTVWEFKIDNITRTNFTTAFDGLVVYNTGDGIVNSDGTKTSTKGQKVSVKPGFYYFYNPEGATTRTVDEGKWVRIGDGSANSKVVLATNGTVVDTNTVIGSTTVKAVKNTITHAGGNSITINKPSGFTKLYSIKIYKVDGTATTLVGTNLYSYADEGTDKLKLVFGNGIISTSYPKGEYEYVLEYL